MNYKKFWTFDFLAPPLDFIVILKQKKTHFLNEFIFENCYLSDSFDYLYIIHPEFSVFMHQITPQRHLKSACITVKLH